MGLYRHYAYHEMHGSRTSLRERYHDDPGFGGMAADNSLPDQIRPSV